jgi:predicted ATP-binding protein involved in virulence
MRIDKLELENFRGFKKGTFEFPRASSRPKGGNGSFNLLAGPNGAGKSSILEGLAVAASGLFLSMRGPDIRHITNEDVHTEIANEKGRDLEFPLYPVKVTAKGILQFTKDGKDFSKEMTWTRSKENANGRTTLKGAKDMAEFSAVILANAYLNHQNAIPLVSYYGAGRLWTEPSDTVKKRLALLKTPGPHQMVETPEQEIEKSVKQFVKRISGYSDSVNGRCSPRDLQRWLALEDYKEYRTKSESIHGKLVKEAILQSLPDFEEVKVSPGLGKLIFKTKNQWIEFSKLSEGQRDVCALVGDIAWKAAQLNPHLGEDALRKTRGIVLIDELEQHLHPSWQRLIVHQLQEIYPEIQFICATHSPQVIGEVPAEEIRLLSDGEDYSPPYSKGIDSSRILDEIMRANSRSKEDSQKIRELAEALNEEDFQKSEDLLCDLINRFGENDPEVTRGRTLLNFLKDTA